MCTEFRSNGTDFRTAGTEIGTQIVAAVLGEWAHVGARAAGPVGGDGRYPIVTQIGRRVRRRPRRAYLKAQLHRSVFTTAQEKIGTGGFICARNGVIQIRSGRIRPRRSPMTEYDIATIAKLYVGRPGPLEVSPRHQSVLFDLNWPQDADGHFLAVDGDEYAEHSEVGPMGTTLAIWDEGEGPPGRLRWHLVGGPRIRGRIREVERYVRSVVLRAYRQRCAVIIDDLGIDECEMCGWVDTTEASQWWRVIEAARERAGGWPS